MQVDIVFTSFTQSTGRQFNFCFRYRNASSSDCISDVASTNRTKQFAFVTSRSSDSYFAQLSNFVSACLCSRQLFSNLCFVLSTTCFELFNVCFSCRYCFTLWEQEVTSKTSFNVYSIAQTTQVSDFVYKMISI